MLMTRRMVHCITACAMIVAWVMLPLGHVAQAEDGAGDEKPVKVVTDQRNTKLTLPKDSTQVAPNATLPAPGGGTINWSVSSNINLYQYGYADCDVRSQTSALVWQLYLETGLWNVAGRTMNSVTNYQADKRNISNYNWYNGKTFTGIGTQRLQCIGDQHVAVVSPGGMLNKLPSVVETDW